MAEAWVTVTPTWHCQTGSPSIGNGTLQSRYQRHQRTFNYTLELIAGSTTTFGSSGYWIFQTNLRLMSESG